MNCIGCGREIDEPFLYPSLHAKLRFCLVMVSFIWGFVGVFDASIRLLEVSSLFWICRYRFSLDLMAIPLSLLLFRRLMKGQLGAYERYLSLCNGCRSNNDECKRFEDVSLKDALRN